LFKHQEIIDETAQAFDRVERKEEWNKCGGLLLSKPPLSLVQDVELRILDESFMPEIPCQRNRQRPKFVQSIIVKPYQWPKTFSVFTVTTTPVWRSCL
jgi:hypothetical protein